MVPDSAVYMPASSFAMHCAGRGEERVALSSTTDSKSSWPASPAEATSSLARCPVPGARCPVPGARCPVPGARWHLWRPRTSWVGSGGLVARKAGPPLGTAWVAAGWAQSRAIGSSRSNASPVPAPVSRPVNSRAGCDVPCPRGGVKSLSFAGDTGKAMPGPASVGAAVRRTVRS